MDTTARSRSISVRLPAVTLATIERQAAEAGLTVGAFLRAHLTVGFHPRAGSAVTAAVLPCDEDTEHVHAMKASLYGPRRCECGVYEKGTAV